MAAPSTQPTVTPQAGPPQFSGNTVLQSQSHSWRPPTRDWYGYPTPSTTLAPAATSNHVATQRAAAERLPTKLDMFEEVADSQASYTDSSSALFALYLSHAEKHDRDQTDSWKADADGILVFVRSLPARHHERGTDVINLLWVDRSVRSGNRHVRHR